MKNATKYQAKIKKLLAGIEESAPDVPAVTEPIRAIVEYILAADATDGQVEKALASIDKEFVDVNELRVSPTKEIVEALGRDFPDARRKADEIVKVLNAIFNRYNKLSLEKLQDMTKRDLRRCLTEFGMDGYAAACTVLYVFGGHAVPVDQSLVDCLEMDGYIEPGSTVENVQGFLERVILQKHDVAAHRFFRRYVAERTRALARKRKADAIKAQKAAEAAAAEAARAAEAQKARAAKRRKAARRKQAAKAKKAKAAKAKTAKTTKSPKTKKAKPAKAKKSPGGTKKAKAAKTKKAKAAKTKKARPARPSAGTKKPRKRK
ncbi:MAG: hypothetical protein J7M21_00225 [Planctomycetes bacterium]|nr:hypothetical protein [Planctomycetota bacterium]